MEDATSNQPLKKVQDANNVDDSNRSSQESEYSPGIEDNIQPFSHKDSERKEQLFELIASLHLAELLLTRKVSKDEEAKAIDGEMLDIFSVIFKLMQAIILFKSIFADRMDIHSIGYPCVISSRPQFRITMRIFQKLCENLTQVNPVLGEVIFTSICLYLGDDQKINVISKQFNTDMDEVEISTGFIGSINKTEERLKEKINEEINEEIGLLGSGSSGIENLITILQEMNISKDEYLYYENNLRIIDKGLFEFLPSYLQSDIVSIIAPSMQQLIFNLLENLLREKDFKAVIGNNYFKCILRIANHLTEIKSLDNIKNYIHELLNCVFSSSKMGSDWRKEFATFVWKQDESSQFDPFRNYTNKPQRIETLKKDNPFHFTLRELKTYNKSLI